MSNFTLIIGNKNNSTWSLRGYLALKHAGINFDEIMVSLRPRLDREKLDKLTPAGKVPTLKHNDAYIWDSLAICEYMSDLYPEKLFWPEDINIRAQARCAAAEMHSGFNSLRSAMPMACHSVFDRPQISNDLNNDIERVVKLWTDSLTKYAELGPYLYGTYSIADMMFAPLVFRFKSYQIGLPQLLEKYCDTMTQHPDIQEWLKDANPDDAAEPDERL